MTAGRGTGRFASRLPTVTRFVSLGEGDTPLVPLDRLARRLRIGRLSAKVEAGNPLGSHEDRVAAMSISLAIERGKRGWVGLATARSGAAMAAYGARAGLPGLVCVLPSGMTGRIGSLSIYGAQMIGVADDGASVPAPTTRDVVEAVRDVIDRHDLYPAISAHEVNGDGMRGADAIGYELAEQVPNVSHVYVPVGEGGLLSAVGRGLRFGGNKAKVVACQPAGCAPVVYYLSGVSTSPSVYRCEGGISALRSPHPLDGRMAAETVRRSAGWGTVASDEDIDSARRLLAAEEGLDVVPAAATTLAALIKDLEHGRIDATGHQVLVLSGAGGRAAPGDDAVLRSTPVVGVKDLAERIERWAEGLAPR